MNIKSDVEWLSPVPPGDAKGMLVWPWHREYGNLICSGVVIVTLMYDELMSDDINVGLCGFIWFR